MSFLPGIWSSSGVQHLLLEAAMSWFMVFVLVLVRLSGLMLVGPFFGHAAIPLLIRVLLAF